MENLTVKLEVFEGPLDLLLRLIDKNKVSITDIPIALILEQYLEELDLMRRMDMDVAGEFIVTASELMLIKSRMLLPKSETEHDDPREKLAAALIEYQKMKAASEYLNSRFAEFSARAVKDTDEVTPDGDRLDTHDAALLRNAMISIMSALDKTKIKNINASGAEKPFEEILRTPIVPVTGKIFGIIRYLVKHGEILYTSILLTAKSKSELIATFLAMLELIKNNRVVLHPVGDYTFEEGPNDFAVTLNKNAKAVDL